jgi:hypothetical protein
MANAVFPMLNSADGVNIPGAWGVPQVVTLPNGISDTFPQPNLS